MKFIGHAKQSATDAFESFLKRVIQKTGEETGGLIGNNIPNRIMKVSKSSPHNNSETSMITKYLRKDIYLQKKNRKL